MTSQILHPHRLAFSHLPLRLFARALGDALEISWSSSRSFSLQKFSRVLEESKTPRIIIRLNRYPPEQAIPTAVLWSVHCRSAAIVRDRIRNSLQRMSCTYLASDLGERAPALPWTPVSVHGKTNTSIMQLHDRISMDSMTSTTLMGCDKKEDGNDDDDGMISIITSVRRPIGLTSARDWGVSPSALSLSVRASSGLSFSLFSMPSASFSIMRWSYFRFKPGSPRLISANEKQIQSKRTPDNLPVGQPHRRVLEWCVSKAWNRALYFIRRDCD